MIRDADYISVILEMESEPYFGFTWSELCEMGKAWPSKQRQAFELLGSTGPATLVPRPQSGGQTIPWGWRMKQRKPNARRSRISYH